MLLGVIGRYGSGESDVVRAIISYVKGAVWLPGDEANKLLESCSAISTSDLLTLNKWPKVHWISLQATKYASLSGLSGLSVIVKLIHVRGVTDPERFDHHSKIVIHNNGDINTSVVKLMPKLLSRQVIC